MYGRTAPVMSASHGSDQTNFGRTLSFVPKRSEDIAGSVAGVGHSSDGPAVDTPAHAPPTRMARRTTGGVPVAVFRRLPGIPPVAVTRLPDQPVTPQPLP